MTEASVSTHGWQSATAMLPAFTAALLVASVAYDYAFLLALDLSFNDVPSGLSEHVRSAIVWAPKVAIAFGLYLALTLLTRRIEGGLTEEELIASSATPRFTRGFRRSGDIAIFASIIASALIAPFLSSGQGWMFFTSLVLWGLLVLAVVTHPRLSTLFPGHAHRLALVSPILICMVCVHGYSSGAALTRCGK